jgi:hypothetical protein
MDADEYRQSVLSRYRMKGPAFFNNYITDLTGQITVNSRVASRKFYLFNLGAWLTASACAAICVPAAIWLGGTLGGAEVWLTTLLRGAWGDFA